MLPGPAHVALNAHLLAGQASYRSAGIHHYIDNVLRHLPAADSNFRYTVFVGEGQPDMPGALIRRTALPTRQPLVRIFWEQVLQPLELARVRPDLLHSLAFVLPVGVIYPSVVTVYDLSFKYTPDRFSSTRRLYLSMFTAQACRRARRVITISESTKADVTQAFGIAPEKVDVAYPGLSPAFRPLPRAEVEAFRVRRGLPGRFILYLGTLEPRKNLDVLLRAFDRLRHQAPDIKLVLAGGRGWRSESLLKLIQELNLQDAVLFPGFLPGEDLPCWYNAAAVFVYPSSYEGFGIPVAEALACGRPVVTSNVSSLPEAGGDAALLTPPGDVAALTESLAQALTLTPEQLARGPAHAARFTWTATAKQTTVSYHRALSEN